MNHRQPRILRGVTRTVRMTILDGKGGPVDLSFARKVTVTVSLDGAGKSNSYTPAFVVGGQYDNVVSFVWFADMQQRCGRYTFEMVADYGDRNKARVNWHREWGVELVEYNCDEGGSLPETLDLESYIDLTGSVSMDGVGMSAYEQWLSSEYSEGYDQTVDGFMAWIQRPAEDAAAAAGEEMGQIHTRADGDHTRAEEDHNTATEDHMQADHDHTRAEGDHNRAESDHQQAGTDHQQAVEDSTRAGQDHLRAAEDHNTAAEDHMQADQDHTRAEGDHNRAESDHQQAGADHQQAVEDSTRASQDHLRTVEDHNTAAEDHMQADQDHTRAEGDHNRAESDHQQAGADHQQAVEDSTRAGQDHQQALSDHETWAGKADKDTDATEGNIAAFDANGNPIGSATPVRAIGETDWREEQVTDVMYESGSISKTDGSIITNNAWKYTTIQLGNARKVRFMGNQYADASQWNGGYAFYDENEDTIAAYSFNEASPNAKREYVVVVPAGAVSFRTIVYAGTSSFNITREEDFYCYLQFGETIADKLTKVDFEIVGNGNTNVTRTIYGLIPGHRYRLYLENWDTSGVTLSVNYNILGILSDGANYLVREYVGSVILPYYDYIFPAASFIKVQIRATSGCVIRCKLEDITFLYEEIVERRKNDLEEGFAVTLGYNDLVGYDRIFDNFYLTAGIDRLGKVPSIGSLTETKGIYNFKIPVEGIKRISLFMFRSTSGNGSLFIDDDGITVYPITSDTGEIRTYLPPSSAKYLIYSVPKTTRNRAVVILEKGRGKAETFDIQERMRFAHEVSGQITIMRDSRDFLFFDKYGFCQYLVPESAIGTDISENKGQNSLGYHNYLIPVEGWDRIGFYQFKTNSSYGSAFLDENMVIVDVAFNRMDERNLVKNVPAGAKWFFYSCGVPLLDYVTFYKDVNVSSRLNAVETKVENITSSEAVSWQRTGAAPRYRSGIITAQGGITENAKYVTTEPIFGNFALGVADGFLIFSGTLVDRNGNVVSHEHIPPMSDITAEQASWSARLTFSSLNMPAEYGYRLVICKADGTDITGGEKVITSFVSMGNSPVKRWIPDGLANYDIAQRRIEYMQKLLWTPISKVPDGSDSSYATNTYFCLPGHLMTNVPYSDLGLTRKFVPSNVSIRTFLTAAKNKRSLLYTENLFGKTSGYGISYTNAYRCGSYYGCACNAFVAWVMGLKTMYLSGDYHSNEVPGLSTVSSPSVDNVHPLDLVWNQGHISMISDVFKDDYGKVRFVVWAEMTTPYAKRTIYTAEQFEARLSDKDCTVHRWNGWDGITEPPTVPGYNLHQIGGTDCDVPYCEDIMCFAGDFASFASGEKVFLNARRGETYTGVELYKDDVLLQTIDITELAVDGSDGEDWVRVDLGTALAPGKYKARLTDGTNTTGYTYFEVIGITFSASPGNGNITLQFSATGGTPVSLEGCGSSGFAYYFHPITAEDIQAGSVTKSWSSASNNVKLYLLVQGDYGTVCKIIDYPTA